MEQVYDYVSLSAACGEKPSFSTLVTERFYNDIIYEIGRYNKREKASIRPISVKKIFVTRHDIDSQVLYFDTLVNCVLNENGIRKPIVMIVDSYFDLDEEFETVHTRCAIPVWSQFHPENVLPDDLIPIISKNELDSIALCMINNLYPRTRKYAVQINVNQVVRHLGLSVQDVHFDSDEEMLGKIFFEDASTIVVDPSSGMKSIIPVSAGTILVNSPIGKIVDERIRNNTILHECVHWMLHRPAFLLAKLWNHEYAAVACRRSGGNLASKHWTAIDRMEWQASVLAPRMLMPDWATRFVASEWLRRYDRLSPVLRMEKTIDQLSRYFNVSRHLAKIRMTELGYEDAKTAFSYYDKRKHTITFENAVREAARNTCFRETLSSGIYEYVDNCFVIRDRKYILRDETGILHLTTYAKSHLDECCLAFASRRINYGMQHGMLRYNAEDEMFIVGTGQSKEVMAARTKNVTKLLQSLPLAFSDTLAAHMKRLGITTEKLSENSLISIRQITRYRTTAYPTVRLSDAIGICIGLKLHPVLALDLIRKAGLSFNSSEEHTAYQTLLFGMTNSSIFECNDYLVKMGIKPIGKEE